MHHPHSPQELNPEISLPISNKTNSQKQDGDFPFFDIVPEVLETILADDDDDNDEDDNSVDDDEGTYANKDIIATPNNASVLPPPNKKQKMNKKKKKKPKPKPLPVNKRVGTQFDPPQNCPASKASANLESFKKIQAYCDARPHLNSPIPFATLADNLNDIFTLYILHFAGTENLHRLIKDGLLWKTKNGYIGEACIRLDNSIIKKTQYSLGLSALGTETKIAVTDICMSPGPNNCGGDHNNFELQALTTDYLLEILSLMPNLQNLVFLGKKLNEYAATTFYPELKAKKQFPVLAHQFQANFMKGCNNIRSKLQYFSHPQRVLMGLNDKQESQDRIAIVQQHILAAVKIDIYDIIDLDDDDNI